VKEVSESDECKIIFVYKGEEVLRFEGSIKEAFEELLEFLSDMEQIGREMYERQKQKNP